jgi:hypothetical protein
MKLQKAGASVLSAIALDARAAPVIAQRGGLAALVAALRANANADTGAHDIEVHDACTKALNHFSGHSCCTAESRAAVEAAGVVHELLAVLSSAYRQVLSLRNSPGQGTGRGWAASRRESKFKIKVKNP